MSEAIERLQIRDRLKLETRHFEGEDKLYVAFDSEDIDALTGELKFESIRFPDFSCNWSRFSEPADLRIRPWGQPDDGCYSIRVSTARYKQIATPVHDPIQTQNYENYAHVEVRELLPGESIYFEPPRGRKSKNKTRKNLRMEYRQNIVNNRMTELDVGESASPLSEIER